MRLNGISTALQQPAVVASQLTVRSKLHMQRGRLVTVAEHRWSPIDTVACSVYVCLSFMSLLQTCICTNSGDSCATFGASGDVSFASSTVGISSSANSSPSDDDDDASITDNAGSLRRCRIRRRRIDVLRSSGDSELSVSLSLPLTNSTELPTVDSLMRC